MKQRQYFNQIDFFAREPHHIQHAKAIYNKIPLEHRGKLYTVLSEAINSTNDYIAIFCYGDLKSISKTNKKIVYCEHGVGMYYNTIHGSYAGSTQYRDNVVLRLSPNKTHADKEKKTLKCPVKIVGVPKMDEWAGFREKLVNKRNMHPFMKPVVAISFHWNCLVCPETESSYKHFASSIKELSKHFTLIGHGHPRILPQLRTKYKQLGIQVAADFNRVMRIADMYICDNSSTIYEFAYLNKPVVLLNAPSYRKNVEHKGNPRFWKHANIGPQVDNPEDLITKVQEAWDNFALYLRAINDATNEIFTYTDGRCGERAAQAILEILE